MQGFTDEALAILSSKKGGNFIVLKGDVEFIMPDMEYLTDLKASFFFSELREHRAFTIQSRSNFSGLVWNLV